ncbi:MAG: nitroreductase/quinone reductase family protein [Actinomycetota bacterium]
MEGGDVNAVQSLVQTVAGTRPGARLARAARIDLQDRLVHRVTGGRVTVTGVLAGIPTILVTTTGRRGGRPHTVPLVRVTDPAQPGTIAVVASSYGRDRDPEWALDLRARPHAVVTDRGRSRRHAAREVTGDEYERWFQRAAAVCRVYPRYRRRARRRIPIFTLTPVD